MGLRLNHVRFNISGSAVTNTALTNGSTTKTDGVKIDKANGTVAFLVTENKSGGAGSIDISTEYSVDGTNYYRAYTTSAGTLTVEANVVSAIQNVTRYIIFTLRPAEYVRLSLLANADSQVTADIIMVEHD